MRAFIFLLFLSPCLGFSQQAMIDSLNEVIESHPKDSVGVDATLMIANFYYMSDPDTTISMVKEALETSEEINYKKGIGDANGWLGYLYTTKGDYFHALKAQEECLTIMRELEIKEGEAATLNNIGILYKELEEYETAKQYFEEALDMYISLNGDSYGMGVEYNNIADVYRLQEDTANARTYYLKGLTLRREGRDTSEMGNSLSNLGLLELMSEDYTTAISYFDTALNYQTIVGHERGMAVAYVNRGLAFYGLEKYQLALTDGKQGLEHAESGYYLNEIYKATDLLYKVHKAIGNESKSLHFLEYSLRTNDSLNNDQTRKDLIKLDYQVEYEKRHLEDSLASAEIIAIEKERNERKLERQSLYTYFGIGIAALMLLLFIVMLSGYNQKKKRNSELREMNTIISDQKLEVEEKNREITDSIHYAKRIQTAILPPKSSIEKCLPNSFILYLPKDIVAGDFYWLEQKDGKTLFAAADCTGHGVPGAMVSVICNNGLNRSVREHGLTTPGKILEKTREIVIQEFEKSEEEVRDGMDVALCCLEGKKLSYAGAHNPLWILRKGASEIEEYKADKQPIGKFVNPLPYQTHELELNSGDTLFIFSDGYVDQFGGEKGKKFKPKALKQLLIENEGRSMAEYHQMLEENFHRWKGNLEQVDDVCVIGVRV